MILRAEIMYQPWSKGSWTTEQQIQNAGCNTIGLVAGNIYFEGLHTQVKQINSNE